MQRACLFVHGFCPWHVRELGQKVQLELKHWLLLRVADVERCGVKGFAARQQVGATYTRVRTSLFPIQADSLVE